MKVIYEVIAGSRMRGLNLDDSDLDVRYIYIPSFWDYWGLEGCAEQINEPDSDTTGVRFDVYARLLGKPDHLEWLYNPHPRVEDIAIGYLRENRDQLVTQEVVRKQLGAAIGQWNQTQGEWNKGDNYITEEPNEVVLAKANKLASEVIRRYLTALYMVEHASMPSYPLPQQEQLLQVKRGQMPREQIRQWVIDLYEQCNPLPMINLPPSTPYDLINKWLWMCAHRMEWS